MSQRMKILNSVSEMIDFIKEKTRQNLIEGNRGDKVNLDEESLRQVLSLVDQSISQAYSTAYTGVERTLRAISSPGE